MALFLKNDYSNIRVLKIAMYNYIEVKKIHFGFLSCVFIKVYSQCMSISNRCVIWLQPSAIN